MPAPDLGYEATAAPLRGPLFRARYHHTVVRCQRHCRCVLLLLVLAQHGETRAGEALWQGDAACVSDSYMGVEGE